MNGNDSIIRAILNQKKQILMAGVWILIAEAIFGFFVILSQVWDPLIGKIQAIFFRFMYAGNSSLDINNPRSFAGGSSLEFKYWSSICDVDLD